MAQAEELLAIVGSPVDSDAVRSLVAADKLRATTDRKWDEGGPRRGYFSNTAGGYGLVHHGGRVATAFLYAEPGEGFDAFPSPLPGGLTRGSTRSEVRARFGAPERSGEAVTISGLGLQGAWDRFVVGVVRVHFQYTEPDQRVRLVTIMTAEDAP